MISEKGLSIIKKFEGLSTKKYICPAGYKTIGYGHLITEGENFDEVSAIDAEEILRNDVKIAESAVRRLINVPLNQNQYDALVSFCFNVGSAALQRSTMRQKINRLEHALVPKEFKKWIYANGKILKGLVCRRIEEAKLYAM